MILWVTIENDKVTLICNLNINICKIIWLCYHADAIMQNIIKQIYIIALDYWGQKS